MEAVNNTVKANKRICETFFEELHNRANLDIIDELVDTNVVSHDPFPGQLPGAEGVKQTMRIFRSAFPDLHIVMNDMIAEGDKVMCKFSVKGTHNGEFMGVPATGNQVLYEEVIIVRFENGKIVEHWAVADALSLLQQIGAVTG